MNLVSDLVILALFISAQLKPRPLRSDSGLPIVLAVIGLDELGPL